MGNGSSSSSSFASSSFSSSSFSSISFSSSSWSWSSWSLSCSSYSSSYSQSSSSASSTSLSSSSSGSMSYSSSSSSSADFYPGDDQFDWSAVPDWFWWGPRVTMKFDIRSGNTPEPKVDHSITLTGDAGDGSTYDGNAAWDGLGNIVNTGDLNTVVGETYVGAGSKWRARAHYKFDVSAIPNNAAINHATLYMYFSSSYGNGVLDAAPDSSRVGRITIDHMDDWGAVLPASEFQEAARLEDIDILIGNDKTPDGGRWVAVNVTTFIQEDVSVQHSPDTSCFRFRQSRELDYASCAASNLWMLASADDSAHQPYIVVNYFVEGVDWLDWEEAFDNKAFDHTLYRYVQHRFYAWVPHDVRESRDRKKLPQFIYRHFVLKWWGKRYRYEYRYRDEFFPVGPTHIWGYTPIMWGQYRFANDSVISPTLYDELPVFEV